MHNWTRSQIGIKLLEMTSRNITDKTWDINPNTTRWMYTMTSLGDACTCTEAELHIIELCLRELLYTKRFFGQQIIIMCMRAHSFRIP